MAETDGIKQRKALLTTNQQIEHLKSKGVTFKLCSEKDAAEYLANHTYFFKIPSCNNSCCMNCARQYISYSSTSDF